MSSAGTRRKDGGVEAPFSLGSFFEERGEEGSEELEQQFEEQELVIGESTLRIRQYAWHMANGNKVWPGTFSLAEYLDLHRDVYSKGRILELGAATGALCIYLRLAPRRFDVWTSDIDDGGDVQANIAYNVVLNGLGSNDDSSSNNGTHLAHTWGDPWPKEGPFAASRFDYIIASDILLYVSAYPALVDTLCALFEGGSAKEFVMAWNRRIAESSIFFDLMKTKGFECVHLGACVYSFTLSQQTLEVDEEVMAAAAATAAATTIAAASAAAAAIAAAEVGEVCFHCGQCFADQNDRWECCDAEGKDAEGCCFDQEVLHHLPSCGPNQHKGMYLYKWTCCDGVPNPNGCVAGAHPSPFV